MPANHDYSAPTAATLLNALHTVGKFKDLLDEGIDGSITITSREVGGTRAHIFRINPQGMLTDYQVCALNADGEVTLVWRGRDTKILTVLKDAGVRTAQQL